MSDLVPKDIDEWMRWMERRMSRLEARKGQLSVRPLGPTKHLDDMRISGRWVQWFPGQAAVELGYPEGYAGILDVYGDTESERVFQVFYRRSGPEVFSRYYNQTSWEAWQQNA